MRSTMTTQTQLSPLPARGVADGRVLSPLWAREEGRAMLLESGQKRTKADKSAAFRPRLARRRREARRENSVSVLRPFPDALLDGWNIEGRRQMSESEGPATGQRRTKPDKLSTWRTVDDVDGGRGSGTIGAGSRGSVETATSCSWPSDRDHDQKSGSAWGECSGRVDAMNLVPTETTRPRETRAGEDGCRPGGTIRTKGIAVDVAGRASWTRALAVRGGGVGTSSFKSSSGSLRSSL